MGRADGGLRGTASVSGSARVRAVASRLLDDLLEDIKIGDTEALDYRLEELQPWREWITLHRFDRRRVNRHPYNSKSLQLHLNQGFITNFGEGRQIALDSNILDKQHNLKM